MQKKSFAALDAFRLIAALLVVAIHTSPLASLSPDADFLLTRVAGRLAVPFFSWSPAASSSTTAACGAFSAGPRGFTPFPSRSTFR